ncbi:hypothetical protein J6590_023423 [Homalodisca vitripennis]|nr:hypothetical protein J6590_023423 [Homalodisca vitripennis]
MCRVAQFTPVGCTIDKTSRSVLARVIYTSPESLHVSRECPGGLGAPPLFMFPAPLTSSPVDLLPPAPPHGRPRPPVSTAPHNPLGADLPQQSVRHSSDWKPFNRRTRRTVRHSDVDTAANTRLLHINFKDLPQQSVKQSSDWKPFNCRTRRTVRHSDKCCRMWKPFNVIACN